MPENNKKQFLPFHAINEFMRDDFKLLIIQEVLSKLETLKKEKIALINRLIAKGVQIPGFRNSSLAPVGVKARQCVSLFETSPEFAALVIDIWGNLHSPLKDAIWKLLVERNWKPLPIEIDRTMLPGFSVNWPKEETFESFIQGLHERVPELMESDDNISLMVVWIGNKLPYGLYEDATP